jgi:hypothetical protein
MLVDSLLEFEDANGLDRMNSRSVASLRRRLEGRKERNAGFASLRCTLPYEDGSEDGSSSC